MNDELIIQLYKERVHVYLKISELLNVPECPSKHAVRPLVRGGIEGSVKL